MCLLDTIDGALMLSLYVQPAANFLPPKRDSTSSSTPLILGEDQEIEPSQNHRDPVAFLYYSIVLTLLTVIVAIVIGVIQLLTLVLNVAKPTGRFWDGVQTAGDYYDVIGGGICGCFLVVGGLSVVLYKPWRRWIAKRHGKSAGGDEEGSRSGSRDEMAPDDGERAVLNEESNASISTVSYGAVGKGATSQVAAQPVNGPIS
jgi:high-affinity nickel-transport protein